MSTDLEARTRICTRCKTEKPLDDYHRMAKDRIAGKQYYCKPCIGESRRVRQDANPDYYRDVKLKHHYGISYEVYEAILEIQDNVCAICKGPETHSGFVGVRALSVDHNHDTGEVRGLLCQKCNSGLGFFDDDYERLKVELKYLIKSGVHGG